MKKLLALLLLLPLLAHAGSITGSIQTASSGAVVNGTLTFSLNQFAVVSGTAQVVATGVQCYTSTAGAITGEPDPQTAPVLSVNLGSGTLAAGTYFVKYTYFDGTGESLPSPEASVTLVSQGTVIVAVPAIQPANATGWRVSISSATGTETRQSSQTGFAASYQQTAALSAGTALPGSNTSACSIRFTDEMIPSTTYYTINMVNAGGSKIAGYPISQARFYGGTNGSVNVSSGWPVSIGGVIWPSPIVSTPNSGAKQSIAGGLDITGNVSVGGTLGAGSLTSTPFVGPIPWYDVTSPFWGAKCDGSTDDTTAIQNALNAANALPRGTVFIPKGKQCKVSSLSTNGFTGVGVVCGLGESNGRNTSGTGFKFSNATGSLFTSASSFSVSMSGCVLFPSNPAFNGTILDLTASTTDTSNFTLRNSSILTNGSACAIGLDMNKSDSDHIDNNFISGCVTMVRGNPAGSFNNVNHIRGGLFLPDSTTTSMLFGLGDSAHVQDVTFEMSAANNTVALLDCTGAACSNPVTFGPGNWVGDTPAGWTGTWFKNASGQINIVGNVIGGAAGGTAFLTTNASGGGYDIEQNRITGTYTTFLNLQNTSHQINVFANTYSSFSAGTFVQNPTLCKSGFIVTNADAMTICTTSGVLTVPAGSATLVGDSLAQALTGKTLTGASTGNTVNLFSSGCPPQGPTASINGTGAAVDIFTCALPVNVIENNKLLHVICSGVHDTGVANVAMTINLNGQNIVSGQTGTTGSQSWSMEAYILRTGTTTGQAWGIAPTATGNSGTMVAFSVGLTGLSWTSGTQTLNCQFTVAAGDHMTGRVWAPMSIQ